MKTTLTFILFIIAIQATFGQTWSPPGAKWTYNYSNNGANGYVEYNYTGDSVVSSINCKKLQIIRYERGYQQPIFKVQLGTVLTYEQNGVVYVRNNNLSDTLFNFKAAIGDHWEMVGASTLCDSASNITVIDTGTIIINSIPLKFLVINWHYYTFKKIDVQDTIVEKTGFTGSYFFPSDNCKSPIDGNEGGSFRCYSDNNFSTYKPHYSGACDFIAVGINEIKKEMPINIYPNPANNYIYIETQEPKLTYTIYSIDSRLMKEGLIESKQINCEELLKGVYILTIKGENNFMQYFKILKD